MVRRRRAAPLAQGLWLAMGHTALATSTTVAIRLGQIATGTMTPQESRRMVSEKIEAAAEGAAAGIAWATKRAGRRAWPDPLGDALAFLDATSKPARLRVRANAKRLTSRRPEPR